METTRTSSPYFSPNSARAPEAIASSDAMRRVVTGVLSRIDWLAIVLNPRQLLRCDRFWCAKSKRSRSGATSEPFCATWSPSVRRSASCRRWVAEWLARMARATGVIDEAVDHVADGQRAGLVTVPSWTKRSPSFLPVEAIAISAVLLRITPVSPTCPPDSP